MRTTTMAVAAAVALLASATSAAAYAVVIAPHVTSCFYQDTAASNDRIAFSFAVRRCGARRMGCP